MEEWADVASAWHAEHRAINDNSPVRHDQPSLQELATPRRARIRQDANRVRSHNLDEATRPPPRKKRKVESSYGRKQAPLVVCISYMRRSVRPRTRNWGSRLFKVTSNKIYNC